MIQVKRKSRKHIFIAKVKRSKKYKKGRKQMKKLKPTQIATPESAQNDYDYIYYHCNNKWYIDKLL